MTFILPPGTIGLNSAPVCINECRMVVNYIRIAAVRAWMWLALPGEYVRNFKHTRAPVLEKGYAIAAALRERRYCRQR